MNTDKKRVAIIGAGLGGLSCAVCLAAKGYRVEIFEKNSHLGGKLNQLESQGFRFDMGPSILTLPQYFRSVFARAGKSFDDYVTLVPVAPHWRNVFEDGTVIDLESDLTKLQKQLKDRNVQWETQYNEIKNFLRYSEEQYDVIEAGYFRKDLEWLWPFVRHYGLRTLGKKIDYKVSMSQRIQEKISNPYFRDIFEFFIKYVGSSAHNAPAYMNLMPTIQQRYDLWYVEGGLFQLSKAFESLLLELGVSIHTNTGIQKIVTKGKKVKGLEDQFGRFHSFDVIVSNMEVAPTYEKLLGQKRMAQKCIKKFEPACSGLVIHIGTNQHYPQLAHHNFFYAQNQSAHFAQVFDRYQLPSDPTLYVVAASRTDSSVCPADHDNIKILPHIPYLSKTNPFSDRDYQQLKEKVYVKLERMGLKDLRKHIKYEHVWTPHDIETQYNSTLGSIYGVVTDWKKNRGFKNRRKSSRYQGLYFVGASTNPGGGMPMVVLSGQHTADAISPHQNK